MFEDETRLRNLSSKAIDGVITDEEFTELMQLSKAKQKTKIERTNLISNYRETIENNGITIQDMFTSSEIATAAFQVNGEKSFIETWGRQRSHLSSLNKSLRFLQKDGPVLIEIEKHGRRGNACRYCKGQKLPAYVSKALKEMDDGDLETNLARHYTALGREYFGTIDGKVELARLMVYIKTHQVKPHLRLIAA